MLIKERLFPSLSDIVPAISVVSVAAIPLSCTMSVIALRFGFIVSKTKRLKYKKFALKYETISDKIEQGTKKAIKINSKMWKYKEIEENNDEFDESENFEEEEFEEIEQDEEIEEEVDVDDDFDIEELEEYTYETSDLDLE